MHFSKHAIKAIFIIVPFVGTISNHHCAHKLASFSHLLVCEAIEDLIWPRSCSSLPKCVQNAKLILIAKQKNGTNKCQNHFRIAIHEKCQIQVFLIQNRWFSSVLSTLTVWGCWRCERECLKDKNEFLQKH